MNVGYRQSLNVDMAGESVMEDPYANLAQIWHGEGGIVHSRCIGRTPGCTTFGSHLASVKLCAQVRLCQYAHKLVSARNCGMPEYVLG